MKSTQCPSSNDELWDSWLDLSLINGWLEVIKENKVSFECLEYKQHDAKQSRGGISRTINNDGRKSDENFEIHEKELIENRTQLKWNANPCK